MLTAWSVCNDASVHKYQSRSFSSTLLVVAAGDLSIALDVLIATPCNSSCKGGVKDCLRVAHGGGVQQRINTHVCVI